MAAISNELWPGRGRKPGAGRSPEQTEPTRHPGIADVYDAGATEHGHPYFVMELVDGEPVTRYCDSRKLTIDERLRLFVQVCRAIQHAHQKAVIHRDIKPTNILVTEVDGAPAPVVIDFGIAKAVTEEIPGELTRQGQFLGTPQYMSPEQAGFDNLDVDTRSDIYSLGVVLYELVTGGTPLLARDLTDAGYAKMEKMICEEEVPRPTARLVARGDDTEMIASKRGVEPARLRRLVRGDLDWIILKALEKDRNLRYETVSALADDIERHLRHEPVEASPHSLAYRARSFVRRNKAAVTIAAALVAGMVATTWQAVVAERARADAVEAGEISDEARLRAEAAASFLEDTLRSPAPFEHAELGRSITVAEMLDGAVASLDENQVLDLPTKIRLYSALADSYSGRGIAIPSLEAFKKAFLLSESVYGKESPETLGHKAVLALAERKVGNYDRAIALGGEVLESYRALEGDHGEKTLKVMLDLSGSYSARGLHEEAIRQAAEAFDGYLKEYGEGDLESLNAYDHMGMVHRRAGHIDEAIGFLEESIRLVREHHPENKDRLSHSMGKLVTYYSNAGRYLDAIALAKDNVKLRDEVHGPFHMETLNARHGLASVQVAARLIEGAPAEELLRAGLKEHLEVLRLRREHLNKRHPDVLYSLEKVASTYHALKHVDEKYIGDALEYAHKALEFREELLEEDHYHARTSVNTLANILVSVGEFDSALRLFEDSLELQKLAVGTKDPDTLDTMYFYGLACRKAWGVKGDAELVKKSIALHREELENRTEIFGIENEFSLRAMKCLAASLRVAREFGESIRLYEEAIRIRKADLPDNTAEIALLEATLRDTRRNARNAGFLPEEGASVEPEEPE